MIALRFLAYIYRCDRSGMLLSLALNIIIKALELAQPLVLSHIIDLLSQDQKDTILRLLSYFVLLSLCCAALIPWQRVVTSNLLENSLKKQCIRWNQQLLSKHFHHIKRLHSAHIIEALHRARIAFSSYSWQLTGHITHLIIIALILCYILLMKIYWILPLTIFSAILIIYISRRLTQKIDPLLTRLYASNDEYKSYFADLYQNAHNIRMTGRFTSAIRPFARKIQDHHHHMTHISFWQIVLVSTNTFLTWMVQGVLLLLGSLLFQEVLEISTGDILGAYFYSSILIEKIKAFSDVFLETAQWQTSIKVLEDILQEKETNTLHSQPPPSFDLCLQPFMLTAEDHTLTLKDPIRIPYGSKVGIVGPAGAGKTLLLDVITGSYLKKHVAYLSHLDVVDISQSLRADLFSFAESEMKMLSGSLCSAVLFGRPLPDHAESLLQHLKLDSYSHCLHGGRFPRETLSAGEKKRFEIFRSFSDLSPIVILDAPLESLQEDLASEIWRWVLESVETRTLICTDHEDYRFQDFDHIITITQGEVLLQKGPMDEKEWKRGPEEGGR